MVLPDLILPSRANQRWYYSGMDSPESCLDPQHFVQYPFDIKYDYNSRGFRDAEWPDSLNELRNAVWCFGDSFTVGLGQPFDHIWPQVLSKRLRQRTINVSMDGASNDWISRRTWDIINNIKPRHVVVMWSYTHRSESDRTDLDDEQRKMYTSHDTESQDYQKWLDFVAALRTADCDIIQCTIPDFHAGPLTWSSALKVWQQVKDPTWPIPENLEQFQNLDPGIKTELIKVHKCFDLLHDFYQYVSIQAINDIIHVDTKLDVARDGHHFDILTSRWLVDQIAHRCG